MKYALVLLFVLSVQFVDAQTCTGGLGDPIIDITFGAGTGFGPPLASGITNLSYVTDQCAEDGQYTITHSVSNCWGGTWVNLSSDHTGDPNGYFMLINASFNPSDFYVQTVSGLCAATTYQFAAWVLNLAAQPEILPNITFSIEKTDGTLLASIHTGNISFTSPEKWNQYGVFFTTPPGVSTVVLRMTNNAPGGDGNDLALDDITFRPAGPPISAAAVNAGGVTTDNVTVCAGSGEIQTLQGVVGNCYSSATYQWQESPDKGSTWADIPGAMSLSYSMLPATAGVTLYRLTASQSGNIGISSCKVASAPVTVTVLKIPDPAVTITDSSNSICAGTTTTFTAQPTDGGNTPLYQWRINTAPVSTAGPTYTSHTLADGDQVSCVMTSDIACLLNINPVVISNTLSMSVTPIVSSSVEIVASATTICQDSLVVFAAAPANGGSHPAYQWMVNGETTGADTSVFSSAMLGDGDVVSVVLLGSLPCSIPETSNTVAMTVYPVPSIALPPDTVIAARSSLQLMPVITGQVLSYQWSPVTGLDLPGTPDPVSSPVTTTTYQLKVVTSHGCTTTAKETVGVFYDLLMPNAFTPNGDGRNDVFRVPPAVPVTLIRLQVYSRWGRMVFTTSDIGAGWDGRMDGKLQPEGVYVWMIEYYDPLTKQPAKKNGTVLLVR